MIVLLEPGSYVLTDTIFLLLVTELMNTDGDIDHRWFDPQRSSLRPP